LPTCLEGCEHKQQCKETRDGTNYAIYAFGLTEELSNNITDVYDKNNQLVVHNDYGSDRADVSFGKVISQQIGPETVDNTITFDYHDRWFEGRPDRATIYTPDSGLIGLAPIAFSIRQLNASLCRRANRSRFAPPPSAR